MSTSILRGADYLALPRDPETFLVAPLLPEGGSLTIYGDPKVGKSYAAIQLAAALVSGKEWLGFPVRRNGRVVYVQLDTPRSLWAQRLDELRSQGVDIERIHFADRESLGTWPFNILNPDHLSLLSRSLLNVAPIAVIIDTLKEAHQLPENDATEMQKVIAGLTNATLPAALILVHHGRKPNPEYPENIISGARGSNYLPGKMDAMVHFSKKTMSFTGRAIEEGTLKLERMDNGFWEVAQAEVDANIQAILQQFPTASKREQARILASHTGRSEEACRALIRRHNAALSVTVKKASHQ